MNELDLRNAFAHHCISYLGMTGNSTRHRELFAKFNAFVKDCKRVAGLPRTTQFVAGWAWCAQFASTMAIECGYGMTLMPVEMSCTNLIKEAQAMGIWQEDESVLPQVGDWVIYDWDDGTDYATTDNKGGPEHVGIVISVIGETIEVIEGNYSNSVKKRTLKRNARYLRGYICPDFASIADAPAPTPAPTPALNTINVYPLKRGSKGGAVKSLQSLLNGLHEAYLSIDGSFGPKTEAAVIKSQRKLRMEETGVVDQVMWQLLINGG